MLSKSRACAGSIVVVVMKPLSRADARAARRD
jgi:hypothetical protein